MNIISKLTDLQRERDAMGEKTVGFVPTMGALHEGHMSLVRRSLDENDHTIVSIFVNPTQFNDPKDFEIYPKTLESDVAMLKNLGVDLIFAPKTSDMYPSDMQISVSPGSMENMLCGMSRPSHFRGVLTVVIKLFNLVRPTTAYFGQKDYQQFLLIDRMVSDLNLPLSLSCMPIVRETDGLAMSSRNANLKPALRAEAPRLYQALQLGQKKILAGERDPLKVIASMMEPLVTSLNFEIDYIVIVNPFTLVDLTEVRPDGAWLMALAASLPPVRLIDNILSLPARKSK